jgi:hypothetical protein
VSGFPSGKGATGTISTITSTDLTVTAPGGPTTNVDGPLKANLAAGGFKITGLANGSAASDSAAFGQIVAPPGPATTVTGPDAFGAAAVVGTGTLYARNDHDHGLPAAPSSAGGLGVYGDGSDGTVTWDGTTTILGIVPNPSSAVNGVYTLTRDVFTSGATINSGITINCAGFRYHDAATLTNNGTISNNGGAASGTNGAQAGVQTPQGTYMTLSVNGATGNTGNGSPGTSNTVCLGGAGGAGGTGAASTAGSGGTSTAPVATIGVPRTVVSAWWGIGMEYNTVANYKVGAGGGSGGGDATNHGGGGGAGGGGLFVAAKIFAGIGAIQARGGHGGTVTTSTLGAAGGGGGGGGCVVVVSSSVSAGAIPGQTIDANGGTAGTGLGTTFGAAQNGFPGTVILIPN